MLLNCVTGYLQGTQQLHPTVLLNTTAIMVAFLNFFFNSPPQCLSIQIPKYVVGIFIYRTCYCNGRWQGGVPRRGGGVSGGASVLLIHECVNEWAGEREMGKSVAVLFVCVFSALEITNLLSGHEINIIFHTTHPYNISIQKYWLIVWPKITRSWQWQKTGKVNQCPSALTK